MPKDQGGNVELDHLSIVEHNPPKYFFFLLLSLTSNSIDSEILVPKEKMFSPR